MSGGNLMATIFVFHSSKKLVKACLCGGASKSRLPTGGNGDVFFQNKWVEFSRAAASCCSATISKVQTPLNVCGDFTLIYALSVDEHKHSPARMRHS